MIAYFRFHCEVRASEGVTLHDPAEGIKVHYYRSRMCKQIAHSRDGRREGSIEVTVGNVLSGTKGMANTRTL